MRDSSSGEPPTLFPVSPWFRHLAGAAALVILVALVYARVRSAGFIWDDDLHLTANPCIVGPKGLKEIWTSGSANYFPLVLTNFWILHAIWGLNPLPYHIVTVAFHAADAVLLWLVLRRLGITGAWLGAAFWAVHPVQVESVAWVSETKNTQSALFYLLAILFFLRWSQPTERQRRWLDYTGVVICALLALLSKSSTVMLPVVLLLCGWWRQRAWSWREALWLTPLFTLSAVVSAWTVWEQKYHSFALGPEWSQTLAERTVIAGHAVWFYLGKLLYPHPIVFIYPRWSISTGIADFLPILAVIGVLTVLTLYRNKGAAAAFFSFGYFVVLLFPVLGFFNVYFFRYSFVGDHLQYLASMGPLAFIGAGFAWLLDRPLLRLHRWATTVPAAALVTMAGLSARETGTFASSTTLWTTTQARNPDCWIANTILGNDAADRGDLTTALQLHRRALESYPRSYEAHYNLGRVLVKAGRIDDGIKEYQHALDLKADFPDAEHNLGVAYSRLNQFSEAVRHYNRALQLNPLQPKTYLMLGVTLAMAGRAPEAIGKFRTAIQLQPDYADAHFALARVQESVGQLDQALLCYRKTVELDPTNVEHRAKLGTALLQMHEVAGAIEQFEAAIRQSPNEAKLYYGLGIALSSAGKTDAAIAEYETAVRLNPSLAEAHYNLAVALQASGRYAESQAHFATAKQLQLNSPLSAPR